MYKKAHAAIRSNPDAAAKKEAKKGKRYTAKALTYDERKKRVADKKEALLQAKAQAESWIVDK